MSLYMNKTIVNIIKIRSLECNQKLKNVKNMFFFQFTIFFSSKILTYEVECPLTTFCRLSRFQWLKVQMKALDPLNVLRQKLTW